MSSCYSCLAIQGIPKVEWRNAGEIEIAVFKAMRKEAARMSRIMSWVFRLTAISLWVASPLSAEHVVESPREIPVACDVDVVVVGGSSGAVAAACEASRQGANVFLLAPSPYLGTDMCSTTAVAGPPSK